MLRRFAERCTRILIKNNVIQDDQRSIYIYGFELFWSTSLCVLSILGLGVLFGYLSSAITFLLFFMPIRMAAGGYHAKSYGNCFILTNGIALLCVGAAKGFWYVGKLWVPFFLWIVLFFSFVYIWKTAPINIGKHSTNRNRILKNRKYAHIIIIIELFLIVILRAFSNSYVSFTSIIATCAVALMIYAAKREEVKRCIIHY